MTEPFWTGKRVFVTGHTGFKGGWLCLWLQSMGAEVHGYSLAPLTTPNLFSIAGIESAIVSSTIADIRDFAGLKGAMVAARPEVVFHLAAQPLVRRSYQQPLETYEVNVLGVVKLLEAVRGVPGIRAVLNVTTDKCYENREWVWGYREHEALGGHDPYSSSKACAEIVTGAYRSSFLAPAGVAVASARAGNVIGGGDFAEDRLIPDIVRAIESRGTLRIRHPGATRPWQHVLEPLSGYLRLAERLFEGADVAEAWNFGPSNDGVREVGWIVAHVAERTPLKWTRDADVQPHEASFLKLDSSKARARLDWKPRWSLAVAIEKTLEWYRAWDDKVDMRTFTVQQVRDYSTWTEETAPADAI